MSKTFSPVREHFGLTQPDLALYLKVSRSQLHMYERNERSLPASAHVKLGALQQQHWAQEAAGGPAGEPATGQPGMREAFRQRLDDCRFELQRLALALTPLQKRVLLARRRQAAGLALLAAQPAGSESDPAHRWLARFTEAATDQLQVEEPRLALLMLRKEAVEWEAARLEERLSPFENGTSQGL